MKGKKKSGAKTVKKTAPVKRGKVGAGVPSHVERLADLPLKAIEESARNPRVPNKASAAFDELVTSIRANGVRSRLDVRPIEGQADRFVLIDGARRLAAAAEVGLETLPAIVHEGLNDAQAFELTLLAAMGREELLPVEQGRAAQTMMDLYAGDVEAVASRLGIDKRAVLLRRQLANLSPAWQAAAADRDMPQSRLSPAHLELIARLEPATQDDLMAAVNCLEWRNGANRTVSVRAFGDDIARCLHVLLAAPWRTKIHCAGCAKRSDAAAQLGLWPETKTKGDGSARCLDLACWEKILKEWIQDKADELRKENPKARLVMHSYGQPAEAVKKEFPDATHLDNATPCKPKDSGAVQVLHLDGDMAGRVMWMRAPAGAPKGQGGEDAPAMLTIAERRDRLERARWARVVTLLIERIGNTALKDSPLTDRDVLSLVATFGTDERANFLAEADEEQQDWKRYKENKDASQEAIMVTLYDSVNCVLCGRLRYSASKYATPDYLIADAKRIAEMLGISWRQMYDEVSALKDYIEPKSWAKKEREDAASGKAGAMADAQAE